MNKGFCGLLAGFVIFGLFFWSFIVGVFALFVFLTVLIFKSDEKKQSWTETYKGLSDSDIETALTLQSQTLTDFTAIDFETANMNRASACALGLVVVSNRKIVEERHWYINPQTRRFSFSHLHGIGHKDVRDAPTFDEIWPLVFPFLNGQVVVAHNATFDHSVLQALVIRYNLRAPEYGLYCTLRVARERLGLPSNALPAVCAHLGVALDQHHDALSDARAAALVALKFTR